jgi:quinolinate synthase
MAEWDYRAEDLGRVNARCLAPEVRIILWRGFCSVHTKFTKQQEDEVRAADPAVKVLVHPECPFDVVRSADLAGSTEFIIQQVEQASPGTHWAIGTEINLIHRLALEHPEQNIHSLQKNVCPCATMNRIDPAHLLWALENLSEGHVVNPIRLPEDVKRDALLALDRMLALKGDGQVARAAMAKD